ncbi:MarR family transcriptional regulator [Shewanella sp. D64]|uniref:MarR family winged helix-turn-helix transcriptional regulator n=1 Tax=unclassified Shewanella TaxID=196818 RepID=UPI0022BA6728|nr:MULTISPECIES: MarR family transcriptional regulator [unclassified Shewanella]MEC4724069.1 MarR family transcriptional regulator [Shewanella sp. D64]MEC4736089.1 MarR family transcriptional regulator [Shewanella sp. E94]WBJ97967.1 MarR family transcriptional regulator [Shewanella sp. MTB7]
MAEMNQAANTPQPRLSLQQFLPYRLVNVAQSISINFAEVYQTEFELTIPEWRILVNLAEHTNSEHVASDKSNTGSTGISAKELTQLASMDKSTVSRAVKLMLDKGYLTKHIDELDKRASLLTLTQTGKQLYHTIAPKALEWEAKLLEVLTTEEYQILMQILDKLDSKLA